MLQCSIGGVAWIDRLVAENKQKRAKGSDKTTYPTRTKDPSSTKTKDHVVKENIHTGLRTLLDGHGCVYLHRSKSIENTPVLNYSCTIASDDLKDMS